MLVEEFFGGEFDCIIPAVGNVWSRSDFECCQVMANCDRELLCHESGVRSNDGGADNFAGMVGKNLDETMCKAFGFAGGDVLHRNDGFFEFAAEFGEVVLVETDGGNFGISASDANETAVVDRIFGAI